MFLAPPQPSPTRTAGNSGSLRRHPTVKRYEESFLRGWSLLARRVNYRAESMARMCQISIRTLQRHIRAEYGVTLRAWLAECRLHEGRARLAAGERAKVVAIELG